MSNEKIDVYILSNTDNWVWGLVGVIDVIECKSNDISEEFIEYLKVRKEINDSFTIIEKPNETTLTEIKEVMEVDIIISDEFKCNAITFNENTGECYFAFTKEKSSCT